MAVAVPHNSDVPVFSVTSLGRIARPLFTSFWNVLFILANISQVVASSHFMFSIATISSSVSYTPNPLVVCFLCLVSDRGCSCCGSASCSFWDWVLGISGWPWWPRVTLSSWFLPSTSPLTSKPKLRECKGLNSELHTCWVSMYQLSCILGFAVHG